MYVLSSLTCVKDFFSSISLDGGPPSFWTEREKREGLHIRSSVYFLDLKEDQPVWMFVTGTHVRFHIRKEDKTGERVLLGTFKSGRTLEGFGGVLIFLFRYE